MSLAPDNSTICTASADETLRFWKIFESGTSPYIDEKLMNKLNPKYYSLRWGYLGGRSSSPVPSKEKLTNKLNPNTTGWADAPAIGGLTNSIKWYLIRVLIQFISYSDDNNK